MRLYVKKSFLKDIGKLNKPAKKDVLSIIEKIKNAESLFTWTNIKKLKGHKNFYRIRLGKYRIGFEIERRYSHSLPGAPQKRFISLFSIIRKLFRKQVKAIYFRAT